MEIRIMKYDPATDAAPYYATGEVPWKDKMSILEAIVYFHENVEAISFDYSCHGRMCGRCSVMIDGVPQLACCTPISNGNHVIEPHKGFTVIRDLVVDKSSYHKQLSKQWTRIRTEPLTQEEMEGYFDPSVADLEWDIVNCTRCGCCDAACPSVTSFPSEYAGPSTMLAVAYRHFDTYDQADRIIEAVSKGMYHCIMCGKCHEVCRRKEYNQVEIWQTLRNAAEARGLKPSYAK